MKHTRYEYQTEDELQEKIKIETYENRRIE